MRARGRGRKGVKRHSGRSWQPLVDREVLLNQSLARFVLSSANILPVCTGRPRSASSLVPHDPSAQDPLSDLSEGGGARNGEAPNKYCDAISCIQEGIEAGRIAHGGKRQRAQFPAAWPLPVSTPVLPPAAPLPVPTANTHGTPFPRQTRQHCPGERALISEEEMVVSVEYLVPCHFKREERDEYGTRTMA